MNISLEYDFFILIVIVKHSISNVTGIFPSKDQKTMMRNVMLLGYSNEQAVDETLMLPLIWYYATFMHIKLSTAAYRPFNSDLNMFSAKSRKHAHWVVDCALKLWYLIRLFAKQTDKTKGRWRRKSPHDICLMMTSSNENIFRVTGHLCREFTGHRWIPCTKASNAELWCFLWPAPE